MKQVDLTISLKNNWKYILVILRGVNYFHGSTYCYPNNELELKIKTLIRTVCAEYNLFYRESKDEI